MVTGLLARRLLSRGVDCITVKMVQTGCDGFSEDILEHRRICGVGELEEDKARLTAPQIFKFPSSPALSARLEGRKVDTDKIAYCVEECARRREVVLVEGAGGLCVPLSDGFLSVDFAARQGWPLILVTCGRLGSINHTILSLEAAKSRGMEVAGVVFNWCADADETIEEDAIEATRKALVRLGCAPVVVKAPRLPEQLPPDFPALDISRLFGT